MKNYVSPKSVVLSMNLNENIAASYAPSDLRLWYNTSKNNNWATSSISADEWPIEKLIDLLDTEFAAQYKVIYESCNKTPDMA